MDRALSRRRIPGTSFKDRDPSGDWHDPGAGNTTLARWNGSQSRANFCRQVAQCSRTRLGFEGLAVKELSRPTGLVENNRQLHERFRELLGSARAESCQVVSTC